MVDTPEQMLPGILMDLSVRCKHVDTNSTRVESRLISKHSCVEDRSCAYSKKMRSCNMRPCAFLQGGKWTFQEKRNAGMSCKTLDTMWLYTMLCLIGENCEDKEQAGFQFHFVCSFRRGTLQGWLAC